VRFGSKTGPSGFIVDLWANGFILFLFFKIIIIKKYYFNFFYMLLEVKNK
jgi:hypothetical protein